MSGVQIFTQNILTEDTLVSMSASSAQSAFPLTNIIDFQRRSKVWRSSGNWLIESGANQIVFQEEAGVNLTATVYAVTYNSTTSFLNAITAALEDAGVNNYAVTLDAFSNRIRIDSDGPFFSLITTHADFTLAETIGFSKLSDRTGSTDYTADALKHGTGEWILWDCGAAQNPQAFVAVGTRADGLQINNGADIRLQANITNAWSTPAFEITLERNKNGLFAFDAEGLADSGYRYWRLVINDTNYFKGFVEVGNVFLGYAWSPEQGAVQFPFRQRTIDMSEVVRSERGHASITKRDKTVSISCEWDFLSTPDVEALQDIWEEFGITEPFFVNFDPNDAFTNDSLRNLKLVRFEDEPEMQMKLPGIWTCTTDFREEL